MAQRKSGGGTDVGGGATEVRWLLTMLLLAIVHQAEGLKCWTCMSDVVAACKDPLEPQELAGPIECHGPPPIELLKVASRPVCYKAVFKLNEVETHVFRGCDWALSLGADGATQGQYCTHAPRVLGAHAEVVSCASCTTDGCNGASGLSAGHRHCSLVASFTTLALAATTAWLRA